jgi:hypothetical protein
LFNLYKLYQKLGFVVYHSRQIKICDLLVIQRGSDVNLPDNFPSTIPVHIYNYVGKQIENLVNKFRDNNNPYMVLATSPELLEIDHVEKDRGLVAFPPVYPKYWINKKEHHRNKVEYDLVHIGNKKTRDGTSEDKFTLALHRLVASGIVDVWGNGWENDSLGSKYHRYLTIYNVGYVYSKTKIALGLMYPFQRKTTFSGRFWQAPINGAILFSEPGRYVGEIPGVFESDMQKIDRSIMERYSRQEISEKSIKYWEMKTSILEDKVLALLHKLPPAEKTTSKELLYAYIKSFKFKIGIINGNAKAKVKRMTERTGAWLH